jgi:hypothetical protein
MLWVPHVARKPVSRKQVKLLMASVARLRFDPEITFDGALLRSINDGGRSVETTNRIVQGTPQFISSLPICRYVQCFDFFTNDPPSHRINVEAEHGGTDAVGLK